ncbi:substrate-binding domain-containing protein, partial [Pseudomonas sp.]|uniref:substrate-binding domain-containing protein n=1 Tax=Pseudomonas sp. TaxID=306 RepID=UPI00261128C1
MPAEGVAALRIQGSNTIGASLGPALVVGLLQTQGFEDVRIESGAHENEQRVVGKTADGHRVFIEVAAHGSGTGFSALKAGTTDLAASSRRIKDSELTDLAALGDLKSPKAEQVIAIDGVAVILHPVNPLRQLNTEQLARIFSGEIHNWEELGGTGGAIHLYARDDQSGTFDTFNELVLVKNHKTLARSAKRFESSEQLSDEVS